MEQRTSKERLYWLIELQRLKKIEMDNFCREFQSTYDHDLEFEELNGQERLLFSELARASSRYSPFEQERILYPNVYTDEEEIERIINKITKLLNI
ncbi:magnesium and cobalt transport protein CorA [Paenibacillus sp. LHD-38]|uniref:magnesium and cobalt transport protein CorA n=1 Tax=Paenibacillus sp. LHD-38 TaxID=3072143 RepID=UPI00280EF249|nr:magnesium and cobalt transport protein CorA [Paenibacillus sp. LHD-38]MDQ8734835.1 magnesium and cobalt transport protein CorA [Paenibacillus sp. LHD-38]